MPGGVDGAARPAGGRRERLGADCDACPPRSSHRIPETGPEGRAQRDLGLRQATARWRPLPDFLVIGAQKAGTTALYAYLRWHPGITGPSWKEVSFFDRHWWRGEAWYRGQFPLRGRGRLVGEASPSYLFHPLAPERVHSLVPGARLVALVRDPVARAYSHYQHEVALGREPLGFEDALAAEPRGRMARWSGSSPTRVPSAGRGGITPTSRAGGTPSSWSAGSRSSRPSSSSSSVPRTSASTRRGRTRRSSLSSVPSHTSWGTTLASSAGSTRTCVPRPEPRSPRTFAEPNRRLEALLGRGLGW